MESPAKVHGIFDGIGQLVKLIAGQIAEARYIFDLPDVGEGFLALLTAEVVLTSCERMGDV